MTVGLPAVPPCPPGMNQFLQAMRARLLATGTDIMGGVTSVNEMTGVVDLNYHDVVGSTAAAITDYGAKCDGATDDTTAWLAAIADMEAGLLTSILLPGFSVVGALPTIDGVSVAIFGSGPGTSGLIQKAGSGDITLLSIQMTPIPDTGPGPKHLRRCALRDFSIRTQQVGTGQALYVSYGNHNLNHMVTITNVDVTGDGTTPPTTGFKRGIELNQIANGNMVNVNHYGYISSSLAYPTSAMQTDWAWYVHTPGNSPLPPTYAAVNIRWTNCDVTNVNTAWKCRNHCEGLTWTTCNPAFVGTGWDISLSDVTSTRFPYMAWVNCQTEFWNDGIVMENVAWVNITACQFYQDPQTGVARTAIKITNGVGVQIIGCFSGGATETTGSASFITLNNVDNAVTTGNRFINSSGAGTGIKFTGTSSNCHSVNDFIENVGASSTVYVNDSSNALTNSRRGMRITGATDAQGKQSNSAALAVATALTTSQVIYAQVPFAVTIGDRLRFSLFALATTSAAANDNVFLTVREYNHRAAAAVPFQILKFGTTQRQYFDTRWVNTAVQADAHFTPTFEADVIATAGDGLMTVEVKHTANCTLGICELVVERV